MFSFWSLPKWHKMSLYVLNKSPKMKLYLGSISQLPGGNPVGSQKQIAGSQANNFWQYTKKHLPCHEERNSNRTGT